MKKFIVTYSLTVQVLGDDDTSCEEGIDLAEEAVTSTLEALDLHDFDLDRRSTFVHTVKDDE